MEGDNVMMSKPITYEDAFFQYQENLKHHNERKLYHLRGINNAHSRGGLIGYISETYHYFWANYHSDKKIHNSRELWRY